MLQRFITDRKKPFVENDAISEIGFRMESSALGGLLHPMIKNKRFPSFGYWCDPEFPTTNDVARRSPGSAVLQSPPDLPQYPPLSSRIVSFPVPVRLFEDVHAREFWDVAVKQFSTPILQFRALPIRVVTVYKLTDSHSELSRETTDGLPLEADLQDFSRKIAMGLSPEERVAAQESYEMAQQIIESCKTIRKYWNSSNELKDQVTEINLRESAASNLINTIQNRGENWGRAAAEWRTLLETQITHLENTAVAHRAKIDALRVLEKQIDSEYPFRREVLVKFNKDTRAFAWEIRKRLYLMALNASSKRRLDLTDLHLEVSRMKLCDPADAEFSNTEAGQEFSILKRAGADFHRARDARFLDEFRSTYNDYLDSNNPNHSIFFRVMLNLFIAAVPAEPGEHLGELRVNVVEHCFILEYLRDRSVIDQCPKSWKNVLDDGFDLAREALQSVDSQITVAQAG
jgi:hypothetical protein